MGQDLYWASQDFAAHKGEECTRALRKFVEVYERLTKDTGYPEFESAYKHAKAALDLEFK